MRLNKQANLIGLEHRAEDMNRHCEEQSDAAIQSQAQPHWIGWPMVALGPAQLAMTK